MKSENFKVRNSLRVLGYQIVELLSLEYDEVHFYVNGQRQIPDENYNIEDSLLKCFGLLDSDWLTFDYFRNIGS